MLAYNILTTKRSEREGLKVSFLPVLIGVLLFSMLSKNGGGEKKNKSENFIDMENIQNTVGAINSFNKLGAKEGDTMSVVFELMSNPVVAELVGKFLGKQAPRASTTDDVHNNSNENNGFDFAAAADEAPSPAGETSAPAESSEAEEFFEPVENIAGVEVSEKLKHLYDNWYTKN